MELIMIRHGLPEWIETDDGSPADPGLSPEGRTQAEKLADWLGDAHFDRVYASPLKRAYQTAEPLAQAAGLAIEVREGVAEYDRDSSVYIPVEKLKEIDYEAWRGMMDTSPNQSRRLDGFSEVVVDEVEGIIADNPGKRVAVVCHGGVINVWTAHVLGFAPRLFFDPDYTSINRYMAARSGERTVMTLNLFVHLDRDGGISRP